MIAAKHNRHPIKIPLFGKDLELQKFQLVKKIKHPTVIPQSYLMSFTLILSEFGTHECLEILRYS